MTPFTLIEFNAIAELGYFSIDERIQAYARDVLPIDENKPVPTPRFIDDANLERRLRFSPRRWIAPWLRRLLAGEPLGGPS